MNNAQTLNLKDLVVCEWCQRDESPAIDKRDGDSIEKLGILDPLIAVRDGDRLLLVDGLRRRRLGLARGITKGPVIIDDVPTGQSAEKWARRLRFILNHHRQDPPPSIRANLVREMMETFGFLQYQVAKHLNVEEDTITEWLRVLKYIRPIVAAIDNGSLPLKYAATVFKDATPEGQERIWKHHARDIIAGKGLEAIRAKYPPAKFPKFWPEEKAKPARVTKSVKKKTPNVLLQEGQKKRLLASKDDKKDQLEDLRDGNKLLEEQCMAAGPLVGAFLREPKLKPFVTDAMRFEFETFEQAY
jgi:ParB-like chromosome segregation protein Spo0J